jgi:hypothetical protein
MVTGSTGNISPTSVTVGLPASAACRWARHRALLASFAGVLQHRTGEDVLGLGVGRHPEARHIDADDAHAVDFLRQQTQRHAGGGRHAQVDHDDGVVLLRIGQLVDGLAHVLEQLAGHQRFGVEGT